MFTYVSYNFFKYPIMPSFTKRFEIMVAATLEKSLWPSMPKQSNGSCYQESQGPHRTCTLSMAYQTDVVNKQLVYQLSWNNPFPKIFWLLTYRCRGKIYSHVKNNLAYTQLFNSVVKGAPMRSTHADFKNLLRFSSMKIMY